MQLEVIKKLFVSQPTNTADEIAALAYKDIPQISIEEAVAFIRRHNQLSAWSDDEIKITISRASKEAAFGFTTENKQLTGICFGEWLDNGKTFFCHCLIAPKQYRVFIDYLKKLFPQCKNIEGIRNENVTKIYEV